MILLVDADITAYNAVAGAEEEIQWDEEVWTIHTDLAVAKEKFNRNIDKYREELKCDEYKLCFSDSENFRKQIYPQYKGNRKGRKPVGYTAVKDWAVATYPHFMKEPLEADDAMGILATKFKGKTIIVSMDKDLATIPGKFFRLSPTGDHKMLDVTPEEANYNFLMQALTGDATDGYPGLPGTGPVKAKALLDKHGAVWKTVEDAYIKAGLTADDALLQGRLARILRDTDWDFEKEEVKLWKP